MELQRVCALYGKSNSGKTSTLNSLIDKIASEAEEMILNEKIDSSDCHAIFKISGLKVGVVTQGDSKSQIKRGLDKLEGKCNIIFCATRTGGGTCKHVEDRFGDKLIWIHSPYIDNYKYKKHDNGRLYQKRNEVMAELLRSFI